jgi:hypothetical protein
MAEHSRLRRAVRVLLLDEEDRLLLLGVAVPTTQRALWIAPGGGLVRSFEPSSVGMSEEERADLTGHRWWSLDELERTTDELAPRALPALLRELLVSGPPPVPIHVGE